MSTDLTQGRPRTGPLETHVDTSADGRGRHGRQVNRTHRHTPLGAERERRVAGVRGLDSGCRGREPTDTSVLTHLCTHRHMFLFRKKCPTAGITKDEKDNVSPGRIGKKKKESHYNVSKGVSPEWIKTTIKHICLRIFVENFITCVLRTQKERGPGSS